MKIFWLGIVKNGCGQSGLWTLNLTVSPEWTDEINWFFECWHKLTQTKRWLKNFGVSLVKNRCGQYGLWTLKLILSPEWADGINWFFACGHKFKQTKRWLKNFVVSHGQKWVWPVWWPDSKIDCIWRMNRWNKLIFCMLVQSQEN